jgi:CDGSH-type Zn-finger protein
LAITPTKDGPLMVEGNLEICCADGRVIEKTVKTWLCRCGHSANKPFCDGSHARVGFKAD